MKVCSVCGKQWPDTTRFCPIDGTTLVVSAEAPPTQPPAASDKIETEKDSAANRTAGDVEKRDANQITSTAINDRTISDAEAELLKEEEKRITTDAASPQSQEPLSELIGQVLNRTYKVESKLGQGGMGAVFRARHLGIGDTVALKVISPEHTQNTDSLMRFRREAQAARRLAHPNAVAVHDFNMTDGGLLFMVMEYVDGVTVEKYLQQNGPLTPQRALEILKPVAGALDVAHSLGIIHRDLKPANLMLCQDSAGNEQVKVLDFGTARLRALEEQEAVSITHQGQIFGTPLYMSPEQVIGEPTESTSDIYSLGIILYQMLTNTVPYQAEKSFHTMMAHVHQTPEPPSKRNPELAAGFDELVLKAIEKSPANRYQTAGAFMDRLTAAVNALGSRAVTKTNAKTGEGNVTNSPTLPVSSPVAANSQTLPGENTIAQSGGNMRVSRVKLAALQEPEFDQYVGRENELKRLQSEYLSATEGKGHPTFIIGSPGIGKTQLTMKFRDWAVNQGGIILISKFFDYGGSATEPLRLFKNLLISTRTDESASNPLNTEDQFRKLFGSEISATINSEADKWQIFETLTAAFTTLAKTGPVLLVLDDLQWADALSLEYLGYLLRNTEALPLLFIGTARAEEANSKGHPFREWLIGQSRYLHYEKIELTPFDNNGINNLLQSIFKFIEVSQKDIEVLQQLTSGNPFYLSEVIRMLIDNQKISFLNGIWRGADFDEVKLPDTISNLVRYKLEACSEELRELLAQAAVIGDDFRFELLQLVSEIDEAELEKLLSQGVKQLLLMEEGKNAGDCYRFYITTIRRVIYDEIPKRQRRRYHTKTASAIKQINRGKAVSLDNILSYHYFAAGEWEETLKHSRRALEQALQQQAMDEVVRFSKYAEEALENLAEGEAANSDYQRQIGQFKLQRATALMRLGRFAEAQQEAEEMKDFLEKLADPILIARRYLILTELCYWGSQHAQGVEIGTVGFKMALEAGDEECERYIMFYLTWCQARISKLDIALSSFHEIISTAESVGDTSLQARALCAFGFLSHYTGDWRNARKHLERSLELARRSTDRFVECQVLMHLAWALDYESRSDQVQKICEEGIKISRAYGWRNWEGYFYCIIGRNYLTRAVPDIAMAEESFSRSMAIMQESHDVAGQLTVSPGIALVALANDPSFETVEKIRTVTNILTEHKETIINCETTCALGMVEQQFERWQPSLKTFQRALALADMIPHADCQWRAHFGIAQYLSKNGDEMGAMQHLAQSIEIINRLKLEFDTNEEIADFLETKQHVYAAFAQLCS